MPYTTMIGPPSAPAIRRWLDASYRLRDTVFCKRLGWPLDSAEQRETDQFDTPDAVYVMLLRDAQLVGCARLLSTTGRYMIRDAFPDLTATPPRDPALWELTRYAIVEPPSGARVHPGAATLLYAMGEWGRNNGVGAYLILITPAIQRWLTRHIGLTLEPFGHPVWREKVRCLGYKMPLDASYFNALRSWIHDESDARAA